MATDSRTRSFWALIGTQFFGAFNDNFFKTIVALSIVTWIADPVAQNNWVTTSGVVFVAPFLLFSLVAGRMADRWSKAWIMIATKIFEVPVVAVAMIGLASKNIPMMMSGLALLALQSAFFGPSKYGILPEIQSEKELSFANGLLNVSTFLAILAGTVAATLFIHDIKTVGLLMSIVAAAGLGVSLFMEKTPPANPTQPLAWNPIPEFVSNWRLVRSDSSLRRSLIAVSYFWFLGAVLQLNTLLYVENVLHASEKTAGLLLTAIVVGVALGSVVAGKLSRETVELGLVPLGAIGVTLFTIDLFFARSSASRAMIDAFLLGVASGFFFIPLNTLIQLRSPEKERGRIMAMANFLSFVAMSIASAFLWVAGSLFHLDAARIFLLLGLLSLATTVAICLFLPQALVRLGLYFLTNTVYRIRAVGRENVPVTGPALLVPNHVSMADPFLVAGALSRLVRFLMFRDFYEKPFINPFVRLMDAIPISNNDAPKEIMKSLIAARKKLEEGHLVCIFAEGEMSRLGGAVLGFKRGLDVILKGLDVPVIPVHLEGVWGSIFSFEGKRFFWKRPKQIPYPVTVTYGKPLRHVTSSEIRQAVMELGTDAFKDHQREHTSLFSSFLAQAASDLSKEMVADSSGVRLTNRALLVAARALGRRLRAWALPRGGTVGVLLPPSAASAVANLAIASEGLTPVNLNYTLSRDAVRSICEKAGVKKILTSEKMLAKLGWEASDIFTLIEPLMKFSSWEKASTAALCSVLPSKWLERALFRRSRKTLDETATLMFTSGSTGVPKGVVLTERNVLSNIESLIMMLQMNSNDALLGVLPHFHSFGFTGTLWFPLLGGFKTVFHHNPLDSKTIGELCRTHRVTFLIGTPTFLSAYIRRVPPEDFSTLRFAVAGAEKLRPELAAAFEEKYKVPLLEGYGCTELSPVVALNVPDIMDGEVFQVGRKVGKIGRPLPGLSVKIVDPDTFAPLAPGKPGLLLVRGPNVMKEYLNEPEKTAEAIRDGWYVTGDIATVDEDGFIEITDRLSRFSKIGGEMVPHLLIEQKLQELARSTDGSAEVTERQFVVSSVPDAKKGEALAVLVANAAIDLDDLWQRLNTTDLPKLWIPARERFVRTDALPLLGTGKVDMQKVKELVGKLS